MAGTMPKPRSRKGIGGRPKVPVPKQSVASFRGSAAFAKWFEGLLTFARMPASVLIEHAIVDFAAKVGYKEKPPER